MKPAAALLALVLIVYSNSFTGGFVLDNRGLILNDPRIREASASNLALIVDHTYWWPNGESGLYRPFATLSYLFNYSILGNGANPAGYHAVNLLLHACNVLMAYALALRLVGGWRAFFIAALWAVHPVLTEAVTNIVGRSDLLAAGSVLAALLLYRKGAAWLPALAAVVAIGVFSKESAAIIPLAILVCAWVESAPRARVLAGLAVSAVPVIWMLSQRHDVLAATQPMEIPFTDNPIPWAGFWVAKLTALKVVARAFALIVWPAVLSADYSWREIPLFHGAVIEWAAVALALAIAPFTYLLGRRNCGSFLFFALGLLWLAPVANLFFATGTILAERLLYLPALGVVACVVAALYAKAPKFAPLILCVLIAALGLRAWARNRDWKNDLTIAEASVRTSPASFKTHDLLANVLFASDPSHANLDRVIAEEEISLAILAPSPPDRRPADPYRFAANCYLLRASERDNAGDTNGALQSANRALSLAPLNASVYAQLAEIHASEGKLNDAAVALIEGAFVTSDKTLRQDLVQLYTRGLPAGNCALTAGPSGPAINPACPLVHENVCAAAGQVVTTLTGAGQPELARQRRTMFEDQFHCAR